MRQAPRRSTSAHPPGAASISPPKCAGWVAGAGIGDGLLTLFCRHTSASLLIQENAAPAARRDLEAYFARIAPESAAYEHDDEGPDDMPAHLRTALTQTHLAIPVAARPADARHLAGHLSVRAPPRPAAAPDRAASDRRMSARIGPRAGSPRNAPDLRADRGRGEHRHGRRPRPRRSASSRRGSPRRSPSAPATTTFLLVTRGDARLDNAKCKAEFGARPRMLGPEETLALTGHPVGGVCPFGLATRAAGLSRRQPAAVRPGLSGGRIAQHLGRGVAAAAVRPGRRPLGRPVPASRELEIKRFADRASSARAW